MTTKLRIDPQTGSLLDALNRRIILRGLNLGGRCKWAPFAPGEVKEAASWDELAKQMCARIQGWGLNVMRLSLNWEALEPTRGEYNVVYLEQLRHFMDAAYAHEIAVLLDFHQDVFAAPFCGNGFPRWTLENKHQQKARQSRRTWFLGYALDWDVRSSFQRFWDDVDGIQTAFWDMWQYTLSSLSAHPALIGIDIINEPSWGEDAQLARFKQDVLLPFYQKGMKTLGLLCKDLLVGYGMPGVECTSLVKHTYHRPLGENWMFTPHMYDPSILLTQLGGLSIPPEPMLDKLAKFQKESATPVFLGEFGAPHGARDGQLWLERTLRKMDEHGLHGTLWEYSEAHQLWNEEDLNIIHKDGTPRPMLQTYARPYPRAISATHYNFIYTRADDGLYQIHLNYKATSHHDTIIAIPQHLHIESIQGASSDLDGTQLKLHNAPNTTMKVRIDLKATALS